MEEWKNIEGFEGLYQISNCGRVKSLPRNTTRGKLLKPGKLANGYLQAVLYKDGKRFQKKVHRLVAQAFLPNPNNLPEVNHKNEDKELNFVYINVDGSVDESKSNLEWCTTSYNHDYGTRIERVRQATTNGKCSKTVLQLSLDGEFIKEWPSTHEIQRQIGFAQPHISACCLGKSRTSYGFIWRYKNEE